MAHILSYLSNDSSLNALALGEGREEAPLDAERVDALGFAWVQDTRALERKYPRAVPDSDAYELAARTGARALVGHVREPDDARRSAQELQPLKFKSWVYAQGDMEPELEGQLQDVVGALPDFLRSYIENATAADAMFFQAMHTLFDRDVFHNPNQRPEGVAVAFAESIKRIEESTGTSLVNHHAALLTERTMMVASIGEPMHYRVWSGIEEPAPERIGRGPAKKPTPHPYFRGVLVRAVPEAPNEHWAPIPDRHVLWVGRDWSVEVTPID